MTHTHHHHYSILAYVSFFIYPHSIHVLVAAKLQLAGIVQGMRISRGGSSVAADEQDCFGGRMILVGIKMEEEKSRAILTWTLMKAARPGDRVVALHVVTHNHNHKDLSWDAAEEDYSLVSLVKAFDSVLAIYEGFCHLKQVDLKLKICRGSSVRRILTREANALVAHLAVVGTSQTHKNTIWRSTSVAKYLASKLSINSSVLAIKDGKVVFRKEADSSNNREDPRRTCTVNLVHLMSGKRSQEVQGIGDAVNINLESAIITSDGHFEKGESRLSCAVRCSMSRLPGASWPTSLDEPLLTDKHEANSSAVVLPRTSEAQLKPGWPLLHRSLYLCSRAAGLSFSSSSSSSSQKVPEVRSDPYKDGMLMGILDQTSGKCQNNEADADIDKEDSALSPAETEEFRTPTRISDSLRILLNENELERLIERYSSSCRIFKYQELSSATSSFITENVIGKGGNSVVYRGWLPNEKEVAVKILNPGKEAMKEFLLELEIVTTLNHKNIMPLEGFCVENSNLILVYEFASKGSLQDNLHGNIEDLAFGWGQRYNVALGVAEALDYLHSCGVKPVIHGDVKSSNILLAEGFEAKLSDFGLAKQISTSSSSYDTSTGVAGTFGYLAPECLMYGKVSKKCDVYAFGVVLLELLSGRKPISNECPEGQGSLVLWATPILQDGKISLLLDPKLHRDYYDDQIKAMALAATLCIRREARARPPMNLILKILQGDPDVKKWATEDAVTFNEVSRGCDLESLCQLYSARSRGRSSPHEHHRSKYSFRRPLGKQVELFI